MKTTTTLLLIRHGATASNLENPPRLQGRGRNPPLDPVGVRQAQLTRDALAVHRVDAICASPLERAMQTANIVSEPHDIAPEPIEALTECDVGDWEGLSWQDIERDFPDEYRKYMDNPAAHGYLGGETFADVLDRTSVALNDIFRRHEGRTIVVVAHHVVNRVYLASVLGLPPSQGRRISLDNCGVSIVTHSNGVAKMRTLNSVFHLLGAIPRV